MGTIGQPRPLRETDDRVGFDCGREALNTWFFRHAWRNHRDGISRTYILESDQPGTIAGFVTLSVSAIERAYLPKRDQRNRPDPMPVVLLGQLAVEKSCQGRGYAASLLQFALRTSIRITDLVGSYGVLTHPIDDGVRAFYRSRGFADLPFDPNRAMFVRTIDLMCNGFQQ